MARVGNTVFVFLVVAVVLGLVFVSAGASVWATPNQSPQLQTIPTPVATPIATPTPAPGGSVGPINFYEGGTVIAPDEDVTVTVPPAAIQYTSIDLAYTPQDVADVPAPPAAGTSFVGHPFTLQSFISGEAQPTYCFKFGITITIKVTDADLAAVDGDVSKLVIQHYDEGFGQWIDLPTTYDPATQTVSATVRCLSWFVLAAAVPVLVPTPTPTPTPTPVLVPGDVYLSGGNMGMWLVLAGLGAFLVLVGGFALRRSR